LLKPTTKRITFFSQSLQRTGSEIVLFNLLQNLEPDWEAHLISIYPGVLDKLLPPSISRSSLFESAPSDTFQSRVRRFLGRKFQVPRKLESVRDSLWYVNTIVLPDLLEYAEKHGIRLVVHVHELEQMFELLNKEQQKSLIEYPEWIIANSNTTASVLTHFGRKDRLSVCYPGIETNKIKKDPIKYAEIRKTLGIGSDKFVWLMSGTLDRNKDPLLFVEVASRLIRKRPEAMFVWLGGTADKAFEAECKQAALAQGLQHVLFWIGNTGDAYSDYFNCADGFILSSKRESFSLVTLEALLLGLPVVSRNCGGVAEILKDDIGKIVQGEDTAGQMAFEMEQFMNQSQVADTVKERLRAQEFDISAVLPKWKRTMNEILIPKL